MGTLLLTVLVASFGIIALVFIMLLISARADHQNTISGPMATLAELDNSIDTKRAAPLHPHRPPDFAPVGWLAGSEGNLVPLQVLKHPMSLDVALFQWRIPPSNQILDSALGVAQADEIPVRRWWVGGGD